MRCILKNMGLMALAGLLGACSSGGASVSATPSATVGYGLAGGDWTYEGLNDTTSGTVDRLATALAGWNFIDLPLHSQFDGNQRLHETQFVDGNALRLGMPRTTSGSGSAPATWDEVKATASVLTGELDVQQARVQLFFDFADDAGELTSATGIGELLTGVTATALFNKPDAELLIRQQKDRWNGWYTGELARTHGPQLAREVSTETFDVEWMISGQLDGRPFTVSLVQQTRVFSDIE